MIYERIKKIIEENSTLENFNVTPNSRLSDISSDSLEEVDLLIKIEQELQVKIDLRRQFVTVNDVVRFIESEKHEN